jgi:predicted nucleotidyltransferase
MKKQRQGGVDNRTKSDITAYLVKRFKPKAILLAGSRAQGLAKKGSDWDIFVYTEKEGRNAYVVRKGETLDITLKVWARVAGNPLTNPYGPLYPVEVLYDETEGEFGAMLASTVQLKRKGPARAYPLACAERREKLERWVEKLKKHRTHPEENFYYAGWAYELFVRVWFENRNRWPLPPAQAFPVIKKEDPKFFRLLSRFATAKMEERATLASRIASSLKK